MKTIASLSDVSELSELCKSEPMSKLLQSTVSELCESESLSELLESTVIVSAE